MNKKILVMGDVAVDHLYHTIDKQDQGKNWELYPALHTTMQPGGAFLLTSFVKEAVSAAKLSVDVIGQKVPDDLNGQQAREMIQAKVLLAKYKEKDKSERIRVEKYFGYSSPTAKFTETAAKTPALSPLNTEPLNAEQLIAEQCDANLLLLDDAGNGFRDNADAFPPCINNDKTLLVYKMSRPLTEGKLWETVSKRKDDWVLLLQAKDIRMCPQANVSKALSWERSAMEMVYQLKRNACFSELHKAPYLVILFDTDGALLVSHNPDDKPLLIFDPQCLEGGYASTIKGQGLSTMSAFTASFSANLLQHGFGGIVDAIKCGLSSMRNLLKNGFIEHNNELSYPFDKIFNGEVHKFSECIVKTSRDLNVADPDFWRILDEKTKLSKTLVTAEIVKTKSPKILKEIPVGKYGKLQTIDRSEIEQFNSIKNLIMEYMDDPKTSKPLCIAVFGPPGSGKSFGIKQVLKSLDREDIPATTFNISQYAKYEDLIADFHKVRDQVLIGKVPVAFFDEFDSDKDHIAMGWLKYFLCPMQDGEFKEGEAIHPIGKSIFVFAGGTKSSFQAFEQSEKAKFIEAKGPDFVSRLRGFINILGPNPNHQNGKTDTSFMVRRAKILRVTFEVTEKTSQLINSKGELQIDGSVLRALLNIPEYKHGNRSMNAIIDMSRLTDKTQFDMSALPTPEQLDMHVDAKLFLWLAASERFYSLLSVDERFERIKGCPMEWESELIDKIACQMHEDYCRQRTIQGQSTSMVVDWKDLPDDKKKSNLDAAADIPVKLGSIGYGIRMTRDNEPILTPDITDIEIEQLAEEEHERWCREQMLQGWRYDNPRNNKLKLHPNLVPWNELSEEDKNKDREAIYAIPCILNKQDICIYRIEAYETCEVLNESLVQKIAITIHQDYFDKRVSEGKNVDNNTVLVSFEQLSDDICEANMDSARTIPQKLKLLNIELKKVRNANETSLLELSNEEIEKLSQWEHTRWNWQRVLQGWVYGPKKDEKAKTHPSILPWNQLTEESKDLDRNNIRLIPKHINEAGYLAVRKIK